MNAKRINEYQVELCCGGKKCPLITKGVNGAYLIEDDFGGLVRLTGKQMAAITDGVQLLEEDIN